jgi:hypothetical protein
MDWIWTLNSMKHVNDDNFNFWKGIEKINWSVISHLRTLSFYENRGNGELFPEDMETSLR